MEDKIIDNLLVENPMETEETPPVKKLYLIVDDMDKVTGVTFEKTDYFYQDVPENADIRELSDSIGIGRLKLVYKDGCLMEEFVDTDKQLLEKNVELLKKQIGQLTESIDMRDGLIQELALMVYAHEAME